MIPAAVLQYLSKKGTIQVADCLAPELHPDYFLTCCAVVDMTVACRLKMLFGWFSAFPFFAMILSGTGIVVGVSISERKCLRYQT